jgi:hypothetical protein
MQNKIFLIFILFISSAQIMSQDVIWKKSGEQVEAKITKMTEQEVHYKKYNNQDGPPYTINLYEVSQIVFENGTIEIFDKEAPAPEPKISFKDSLGKAKIMAYGRIYYQAGRKIGINYVLKNIDATGDAKLINQKEKVKRMNTHRFVLLIAMPISAFAGFMTYGVLSTSWNYSDNSERALVVGVGGAAISFGANQLVSIRYKKEMNQLISNYNEYIDNKANGS